VGPILPSSWGLTASDHFLLRWHQLRLEGPEVRERILFLGQHPDSVDSTGDVGAHNSITIGIDGLPVISYYDYTNGNLKVVKCGNPSCSAVNAIVTLDSTGDVGLFTSITMERMAFRSSLTTTIPAAI